MPARHSETLRSSECTDACEIAACLDKLGRVFGYPRGWDEVTAGIWIDALAGIPADLLHESVARYISDPDINRRYFPQPGQLRALIIDDLRFRRNVERLTAPTPKLSAPIEQIVTPDEIDAIKAKHGWDSREVHARRPRPKPTFVVNAEVWRDETA